MSSNRTHDSRRLTPEEISHAFQKCREIGDMRSVGAVLRISAEQLDYRADYNGFWIFQYGFPAGKEVHP
jgi:hypothetical protein